MPRNAVPLYKEFINFCKQYTNMAALKNLCCFSIPINALFKIIWNFCTRVNKMFVYNEELQIDSPSCLYLFVVLITLELMGCQSYTFEVLNERKHKCMLS